MPRRVGAAAAVVGAGLLVGACSGPSTTAPSLPTDPPSTSPTTSPTTVPATPSPTVRAPAAGDVALTGLDACTLFTTTARAAAGLGPASPTSPAGVASGCEARTSDGSGLTFSVFTYPTTPLATWGEARPNPSTIDVGGFAATRSLDAPDGGRTVCAVGVSTAPSATLEIGVFVPAAATADHDACAETERLAGAVVVALRAQR